MNIDDGIVVLSTFNGMSCGMMAFESLGIKVKKYYSVEIDKHANKISNILYPNIIQLGDVTKWESWDIDWSKIDVVLGGSPCQGFSFAGKQLAFDDPRSKLFFEFVKIWHKVKQHNTNAEFLLENVKMKREHELVISRYMGVAPIEINSSLLSAQNRQRLYWTSIANKPFGLFDDMECTIPQPKDKGILLKDVLESDVPEKYYLSDKMLQYFSNRAANFNNGKVNIRSEDGKATTLTASMASCDISDNFIKVDKNLNPKKSYCIDANYFKGTSVDNYFEKSRRQLVFEEKNSDMDLICVAMRGRNPENPKSRESGLATEQQLEPRFDGKTNCLTSVQKDNLLLIGGIKNGQFQEGTSSDFSQGARVYSTEGKSTCLSSEGGGMGAKTGLYLEIPEATKKETIFIQRERGYNNGFIKGIEKSPSLTSCSFEQNNHIVQDYRIRRLTPRECGRLQTIPEDILEKMLNSGISDTQLYRMFGNGWTVSVVSYILSFLK